MWVEDEDSECLRLSICQPGTLLRTEEPTGIPGDGDAWQTHHRGGPWPCLSSSWLEAAAVLGPTSDFFLSVPASASAWHVASLPADVGASGGRAHFSSPHTVSDAFCL